LGLLLRYIATSGAKSDVIFLLGDPDFLLRRRNFAPISRSYRDPHFGLFGGFEGFWGYLATSGAKSDVICLLGDPDFLLGRWNFAPISLSYRDPHFGLFGFFWDFRGYVATSDAKSDVTFLLGDPNFLLGRRNFSPISLRYRDPHFRLFWILGVLGATRLSELTQNWIRSSPGHSTPSLKISRKSVQPFSRNLADKETKKQRNKQRNRAKTIPRPPIPIGDGVINFKGRRRSTTIIASVFVNNHDLYFNVYDILRDRYAALSLYETTLHSALRPSVCPSFLSELATRELNIVKYSNLMEMCNRQDMSEVKRS